MKRLNLKMLGLLIVVLFNSFITKAQKDTKALIEEFNKVITFTSSPIITYQSTTRLNSMPVIQLQDTMSSQEIFYKINNSIYTKSNSSEIYLQDSVYIQIDNLSKTVIINKIDTASYSSFNASPLANKDLQKAFANNYTFNKKIIDKQNDIVELTIEPIPDTVLMDQSINLSFILQYNSETFLPQNMQTIAVVKQYVTEEMQQELAAKGINTIGLIQKEGEHDFYVHKQILKVVYNNISTTKVNTIPLWQQHFVYDKDKEEFVGTGTYKDYIVTQTF
ncbi:MAG: hypothetical protein V4556_08395 [Bacteroidota bacterium]